MMTEVENVTLGLHPRVTFSTSGRRISMSHSLGTVHHLLNVTLFIDCYFGLNT